MLHRGRILIRPTSRDLARFSVSASCTFSRSTSESSASFAASSVALRAASDVSYSFSFTPACRRLRPQLLHIGCIKRFLLVTSSARRWGSALDVRGVIRRSAGTISDICFVSLQRIFRRTNILSLSRNQSIKPFEKIGNLLVSRAGLHRQRRGVGIWFVQSGACNHFLAKMPRPPDRAAVFAF